MMRAGAMLALIADAALALIKTLLTEGLWWPLKVVEYLAAGAVAELCIGARHINPEHLGAQP